MFASPCTMVGPRSSDASGDGNSTQRLLEAAAAASSAHQAAVAAAMAAAVAASGGAGGGRGHERRDGSCDDDDVGDRRHRRHDHRDDEEMSAVDLSRNGPRSSSPEIDVGGDDDDAPLDLKVRSYASPPSRSPSPPLRRSRGDLHPVPPPGLSALPGPEQRAELLRIAELYTSAAAGGARGTPPPPPPPQSATPTLSQRGDGTPAPPSSRDSSQDSRVDVESHGGASAAGKMKQRQYPCQTCGKVFTSASNRNMHQRIHKGVRPFQCTPCGVFFRQKAHLQKHQRTQGHVQATEIYEKKRREGLLTATAPPDAPQNAITTLPPPPPTTVTGHSDEDSSSSSAERHPADSTISASPPAADSSTDDASRGRARSKSSPKRKQSRPQRTREAGDDDEEEISDDEEGEDAAAAGEEEQRVLALVGYNDVTHGYDCRRCAFASHDLSVLKQHARDEHLRGAKAGVAVATDRPGFHPGLAQFAALGQLGSPKSGVATSASSEENRAAKKRKLDSLAEVIRQKQLQHQINASTSSSLSVQSTSAVNGNEVKSPLASPNMATTPRRRKTDLAAVRALLAMSKGGATTPPPPPVMPQQQTSVPSLTPASVDPAAAAAAAALLAHHQFDPSKLAPVGMQDLLRKSENNNILSSSLKLPPAVRLPTQPVHGLTPPSSPPPPRRPAAHNLLLQQQHPLPPQTVALPTPSNGRYHSDNESDGGDGGDQENGLDLSMSGSRHRRRDSGDENGVSSTNNGPTDLSLSARGVPDSSTLLAARALASLPAPPPPSAAPAAFPSGPFPFLLPPVPPGTDPALTEQLLKLSAGLARPPPPPPPASLGVPPVPPHLTDLAKSSPPAPPPPNPYTVLSAMLGQPPAASPFHQPVFPGMAPGAAAAAAAAAAAGVFPSATSSPKSIGGLHDVKENLVSPVSAVKKSDRSPSAASTSSSSAANSSNKPFKCPFCAKDFSHMSSLDAHVEHMHSNESKHVCHVCGKNFSSKSNLTAHKKIHSGERPFECGVCHKRFRQKAHLQKHETTHSSATPHRCSVCDKAFGHVSNLNTHMATHANGNARKSQKDVGKRHRLQAHDDGQAASVGAASSVDHDDNEDASSCAQCPETFADAGLMRRHERLAHPDHNAQDEEEVDDDEDDEDVPVKNRDDTGNSSAYASMEQSGATNPDASEEEEEEEKSIDDEMGEDDDEEHNDDADDSGHKSS